MTPGTYNIPDHYRNDTWDGIVFTITDSNGDPIDLSSATVKMQIRRGIKSGKLEDTRTGSGQAEVTDGPNGEITIGAYVVDYLAATYYYDVQVTFPDTSVKTYIAGTWTFIEDVTK